MSGVDVALALGAAFAAGSLSWDAISWVSERAQRALTAALDWWRRRTA